jgi:hypothetical protein
MSAMHITKNIEAPGTNPVMGNIHYRLRQWTVGIVPERKFIEKCRSIAGWIASTSPPCSSESRRHFTTTPNQLSQYQAISR